MQEILYPTIQIPREQNFQSVVITDCPSVTRTRFLIHKARRLHRISLREHRELLIKNLHSNMRTRLQIQRLIESRQDNYTRQMKVKLSNLIHEVKPAFIESIQVLSVLFSCWLIAVILRSVKL